MNKDKLIEFAKEQCEIFPEDSYMGEYLRETLKMLQTEPCEDAVSRSQALEELEESAKHHANDSREEVLLRRDRDIIRALPPVKPAACIAKVNFSKEDMQEIVDKKVEEMVARKKGKWMYVGDNCFACSECGEVCTVDQFNHINNYCDNRYPKACPNCAIEMESEE
jgi:hypothetical protein